AWGALRLWQFRRRLTWIALPPEERVWLAQRLGCCPPLVVSSAVTSPLAFGLIRPVVVVPADFFERFSLIEQRVLLSHEVAHVAGRDPLWRLLAEVVTRLLWFHPAVWLARGYLVTATEQAADEASLLVEDGPEVLAQCLVDLGRRLQRGHNLGWLGIAAGFRSALGRRVERLLDLDGRVYQPPAVGRRRLLLALASTMAVAAAIFSTPWARSSTSSYSGENSMSVWERSWRHSLAGLALVTLGGTSATADDQPDKPQQPLAVALNFDQEREGDRPRAERERREGDRPREGERREGERREGERREGDRPPRPDGPPREGDRDRPRPDGPPREGDRPRPD